MMEIVRTIGNKDKDDKAPLHFTVSSDDKSINLADINNDKIDNFTTPHVPIESENEECIQVLLDYDATINASDTAGKTSLHSVFCEDDHDERKMLKFVKLMLSRRIGALALLNNYTNYGETTLHYAVKSGSEELVKLLLQYGANVNARNRDGKSSLHFAIERNNVKIARLLLKNGVRVNDKTYQCSTALHEAVKLRSEASVELLLDHEAEVNANDIYGNTPLHLAAQLSYLDQNKMYQIIKHLLGKGANVNDCTKSGESAFHCAIINGNERLVRLFLKYGANVNRKNYDGKSPLHLAVQYSNKNIVKLLLDREAEINNTTNDGKLALHIAISVEDESMIKMLLEHDVDVNVIDKSGKTPLSLAFELAHMRSIYNPWTGFYSINSEIKCNDNIFELLLKYVAKLSCVCKENLRIINSNEELKLFYKNCQIELSKMKRNKLCDRISMYKILTKDINAVVIYARNEHLLKAFKSDLYAEGFPIYYETLKERFYKAKNRRELLESSSMTLRWLIKPFSLPEIVSNEIVGHLTIEDLINLKNCGISTGNTYI